MNVLKTGCKAMDAMIDGVVLLVICEPQMTGIGGEYFFSTAGSNEIHALNGSGQASSRSDATSLREYGLAPIPLHRAYTAKVLGAISAFFTRSETADGLVWMLFWGQKFTMQTGYLGRITRRL